MDEQSNLTNLRDKNLNLSNSPRQSSVQVEQLGATWVITESPVYWSSNLVGTLRLIDSIGLRVERPYSPSSRRIPWYFSTSLAHTHADIDPTMPNMCTGAFYVLQRLNNRCAIYAIYTVVEWIEYTAWVYLLICSHLRGTIYEQKLSQSKKFWFCDRVYSSRLLWTDSLISYFTPPYILATYKTAGTLLFTEKLVGSELLWCSSPMASTHNTSKYSTVEFSKVQQNTVQYSRVDYVYSRVQ